MVSLLVVFYLFVVLFAIIGAMRGWAKELLVSFSVILGLFLIFTLEGLGPTISIAMEEGSKLQFWVRISIVGVLVFFGYQSPNLSRLAGSVRREKISDSLLGFFLGAINGYLFMGTFWYYMDYAGYEQFRYFSAPSEVDSIGQAALAMIERLPPAWIGVEPWIYIAVAMAFVFVLVVFI